jgi:hypothetical protein
MRTNRIALSLLVACGFGFAAPTSLAALHVAEAVEMSDSKSLDAQLLRLAGEWEGQIQIKDANGSSASVISISTRLGKNNSKLSSCFEGFARGQLYEGFSQLRIRDGKLASTWNDSRSESVQRSQGQPEAQAEAFVLEGEFRDEAGKQQKFKQVIKFQGSDAYTHEFFNVSADGKESLTMSLSMQRLPANTKSTAAARFEDRAFLDQYRGGNAVAAAGDAE